MEFYLDLPTTIDNSSKFHLKPENNIRLNNLCGPYNAHIKQIERAFSVKINSQSHSFIIIGKDADTNKQVRRIIELLYQKSDHPLSSEDINQLIVKKSNSPRTGNNNQIKTKLKTIDGRTAKQNTFIKALESATINFAVGPAGTGKTYLSVAKAVESIESAKMDRLIFVRPAVEAGERLGFLPGDMIEKVQPYLRPIYDALYELMGIEHVHKLIQTDCIEIAPLAFMRGRTLNNAFIMLDEAQNTTISQMKMFLTRLGYGSKMVITGDVTQTDLPKGTVSGLGHAIKLMKKVDNINIMRFGQADIVRHDLVAKIIDAYEKDLDNK